LTAAHEPELQRLLQDPQVGRTLGGIRTDAEVREILDKNLDHWRRHGFGVWVFRERREDSTVGPFVGRAGLRRVMVEGPEEVELAYAVMPAYWGQGLATEMGEACLRVGFEDLGLEEIVAFTLPTNQASRRVMEKLGFRYEREFVHAGLGHVLYRLGRAPSR